MPSPSYTYSLSNGTTADASHVQQNFTDILNGVTDGTKDLSISALTAAGTATLNGAINLGNASTDDLTITASLASSLPIKTTNSYDIGSADLGLRAIYLGTADTDTGKLAAGTLTADRTYTFPNITGTVDISNGVNSVSSADYTILDTDGYKIIAVSTGASQRTITLPAVANNSGRVIDIIKTDSGAGSVLVDTPSTETINGSAQYTIYKQYGKLRLVSDGSNWFILDAIENGTYTPIFTTNNSGVVTSVNITLLSNSLVQFTRIGSVVHVAGAANCNASGAGTADFQISLPITSDLAGSGDLAGTACASSNLSTIRTPPGYINADTSNNTARVAVTIGNTGAEIVQFHFTYVIK
jgi:hypothetical protein